MDFTSQRDQRKSGRVISDKPAARFSALTTGLADAVAKPGEDLDDALQRFLEPLLRQAPQVLRAFKALALQTRLARPRKELVDLETKLFSDTWVHPDHWAAADEILEPGGKS